MSQNNTGRSSADLYQLIKKIVTQKCFEKSHLKKKLLLDELGHQSVPKCAKVCQSVSLPNESLNELPFLCP